ncbi:MAG: D-amino-acid transaminase [Boseongicola sp.]
MPRIVYVNGRYIPYREASVHIEDRGFQLADSIYEVCEVRERRFVDERRHLDRLERSLSELDMAPPMGRESLRIIMREVTRAERFDNGLLYIQVTRGVARRDHAFPVPEVRPGLVVMAWSIDRQALDARRALGVSVITVPETRWARVDIKTTSLIANVLAKQAAHDRGAVEAWFVDRDGFITEGASSNAWIVDEKGTLVTRTADNSILRGITREVAKDAARSGHITFEERKFTLAEAYAASEAFLTSASNDIMPIVKIDDRKVGNGEVGPIARQLSEEFHSSTELGKII